MASKFLTGLALGVLAGILLAPDKGSETRRKLSEKGRDLKDKFNDFIDNLQDRFSRMKDDAEEMAEEAKETARSYSTNPGANYGDNAGKSWAG